MTKRESMSRLQYAYSNAKSSWQTTTGEESWERDREVDGAVACEFVWLLLLSVTLLGIFAGTPRPHSSVANQCSNLKLELVDIPTHAHESKSKE